MNCCWDGPGALGQRASVVNVDPEVPQLARTHVVAAYLELRERPHETFVETVKRLGVEPFKERVYATH